MEKMGLVAVLAIAGIVTLGVWQMTQSCAWSSTTAVEEGEPPARETCAQKYAAAPFILLGIMACAAVGIVMARASIAWGAAVTALAACTILGLSWGGVLFFHAVGVLAVTALWHLSARGTDGQGPQRMSRQTLAVVLSFPLGLFAVLTLATEVPVLLDPCHEWNGADQGTISPDDPCQSRTGSVGISRGEYATQLLFQQGGALAGLALAALGAWRRRTSLLFAAGLCWAVVTVAWMFGWGTPFIPFAALAAIACFAAGWGLRRSATPPRSPDPPASTPSAP